MSHSRLSALAETARAVLGLVYAGGALVHLQFWLTNREMYAEITPFIRFGWYESAWIDLVIPNLGVLLPLLAAFELAVAVALLSKGRYARWGLLFGAAFNIAIAPLGFWWPANVALAAVHLALLRFAYANATITVVKHQLTARGDAR